MAVEMVDLVQEAAGKDLVALVLVPVAVAVLRADNDMLRPGDDAVFAGQAQTALQPGLCLLADLDDFGVHELDILVARVDDDHAAQDSDLRPGQTDAVGIVHGLDHILDQDGQLLVKFCDRAADLGQDRVADGNDLSECHGKNSLVIRIDIDQGGQAPVLPVFGELREHKGEQAADGRGISAHERQLVAVGIVDAGDRRGGRAEQLRRFPAVGLALQVRRQRVAQADAGLDEAALLQPGDGDGEQVRERRAAAELSHLQLHVVERVVVLPGGQLQHGMLRRHGLDHGAAAIRAAAGAADDLRDKGERGLRRAEVVDVEAHIRVQHADERDGRKIEALGDHLRAKQDRDLLVAEAAEHRLVAAGGGDGIRVHAQNCRIREQSLQLLLDLLRAAADGLHRAAALCAARVRGLGVAAVVAHQAAARGVIGQVDAAARALRHVAAVHADEEAAFSAAVLAILRCFSESSTSSGFSFSALP